MRVSEVIHNDLNAFGVVALSNVFHEIVGFTALVMEIRVVKKLIIKQFFDGEHSLADRIVLSQSSEGFVLLVEKARGKYQIQRIGRNIFVAVFIAESFRLNALDC